jgi:hypothetical protein
MGAPVGTESIVVVVVDATVGGVVDGLLATAGERTVRVLELWLLSPPPSAVAAVATTATVTMATTARTGLDPRRATVRARRRVSVAVSSYFPL